MYINVPLLLIQRGLVTPYGDKNLGQHWLRWWLVAWRHQAVTWTNVDLSPVRSSGIHLIAISQKIPQPPIFELVWKIIYLKFCSNQRGQWVMLSNDPCQPIGCRYYAQIVRINTTGVCWYWESDTLLVTAHSWIYFDIMQFWRWMSISVTVCLACIWHIWAGLLTFYNQSNSTSSMTLI